jgi:hypothetical protein
VPDGVWVASTRARASRAALALLHRNWLPPSSTSGAMRTPTSAGRSPADCSRAHPRTPADPPSTDRLAPHVPICGCRRTAARGGAVLSHGAGSCPIT